MTPLRFEGELLSETSFLIFLSYLEASENKIKHNMWQFKKIIELSLFWANIYEYEKDSAHFSRFYIFRRIDFGFYEFLSVSQYNVVMSPTFNPKYHASAQDIKIISYTRDKERKLSIL